MKRSIKILVIMAMVLTLILGSITAVLAVPYYNLDTGKVYTAEMLKPGNPAREELKGLAPDKIGINIGGKSYSYNNLVNKLAEIFGIDGIEGIQNFFADTKNLEEFEVEVPDEGEPGPGDELEVIEISAINNTTIKVVFNQEVPAEVAVKANFTVSKGTLETANKTGEDEITLTVQGLDYEDVLTVTVVEPVATKEVRIPAVEELFKLEITADPKEIKSDGAEMTMLTAKIIELGTGEALDVDAQINFTTTLGALTQPEVALQNKEASTQLRSIASPTSVTAFVTAIVASAPGAKEYVGLNGKLSVKFTPTPADPDEITLVSPVKAGADQGDRFFVEFSGPIKAADYKAAVAASTTLSAIQKAGMGVEYIDKIPANRDIVVKDIYNVDENVLMFVLDTDSDGLNPSAVPTTTRIDRDYNGGATKNYLRDNVNHNITFPQTIKPVVLGGAELTFMMSDVTKPFVYGVDAKDNMTLKVRFSEAIAEDLAEGAEGAINGHFTINGKELRLYEATSPTPAQITSAKNAGEIIVTQLKVGTYTSKNDDKRNEADIKIHKDFKLEAGKHGIQIANVGDWAGMTDQPQNIVTTQTFSFTVEDDTDAPTVEVVRQSPEQFLITFNKKVDTITGKNAEDAIKIYTKEGYAADPKTKLVHNANSGGGDYIVTKVDEDGMSLGAVVPNTGFSEAEYLLVEFNRDWSVKLQGNAATKDNYWKSDISPLTFEFDFVESETGVKMEKTTKTVANPYDGVSPTIVGAEDLYEKSPDKAFRTLTATAGGQYVFVEMSEPVQLVEDVGGTVTAITNPVTPNLTQDPTPAGYDAITGLPVQTYRFIKDDDQDKVVYGSVAAGSLAEDDMTFVIVPDAPGLSAGWWTLYIEQISDDHGNTSATVSTKVFVPESEAVVSDTRIAWAAFDNHNTDYDYLYVKFTKVMDAYDANGVDRTHNYRFRGYDLPEGSKVTRGIDGITKDWDGVTIRMDKTAWDGISGEYTTNMSVASNFKSKDGEALMGPYQFQLTNNAGGSVADKDGITAADKFEAIYYNTALVGDAIVLKAEAYDTDDDGNIETIKLLLNDSIATHAAPEKIYVNGKEFVSNGTDFVATAGEEIKGTASDHLEITTEGGAIIIGKGNVVDKARPVILSAKGSVGSKKLTITFSEKVQGNGAGGKLVKADFVYIDTNGANAGAIDSVEDNDGGVTKIVVTLDNDLDAADIGAGKDNVNAANTITDFAVDPITGAPAVNAADPSVKVDLSN